METAPLKSFATWARTELITQVSARIAAVLAPASPDRTENPRAIRSLETDIAKAGADAKGKDAVADKVAYTWFNRIIALRFMDANGYTNAGVVSPAAGQTVGQPEVLADAKRGTFDPDVVNAKIAKDVTGLLDGTRSSTDPQGEAYTLLLAEYSRYWNKSMPFMFEREGDYTELLIPSNLLADESILARAVTTMTSAVCEDVEVIGWLYQFYISERKDEVFAGFKKNKKAGAAEIPAATQLFTPHWIVRYLVENSVGRLWMLNHPESGLVDQMDYYIAPVDEETDFLKLAGPEELTVIDPACGSGHMLTYAFDLLYAIYEEEGYSPSEIPSLILTHNLYGTEIDPRAGSLAAFALTMKARERQRIFLKKNVGPNIRVIEPITFGPDELEYLAAEYSGEAFWNQFAEADTLGALIRPQFSKALKFSESFDQGVNSGDIFTAGTHDKAIRTLKQAEYLSRDYSVVVANPPYMGSKNMGSILANEGQDRYPESRYDLFAMFLERGIDMLAPGGVSAMLTMQSWMFLSRFSDFRTNLVRNWFIGSMAHFGSRAFESIGGEVVQVVATCISKHSPGPRGNYIRLIDYDSSTQKAVALRAVAAREVCQNEYVVNQARFLEIPGSPIAYWASDELLGTFKSGRRVEDVAPVRQGFQTGDNDRFMRLWHEVSRGRIKFDAGSTVEFHESNAKFAPYLKGGTFRKWYGNDQYVVAFDQKSFSDLAKVGNKLPSRDLYFQDSVTWSALSSGDFGARYAGCGSTFSAKGACAFPSTIAARDLVLAVFNSSIAGQLLEFMGATLDFNVGSLREIPLPTDVSKEDERVIHQLVEKLIGLHREDWELDEVAPGFERSPLVSQNVHSCLRSSFRDFESQIAGRTSRVREYQLELDALVSRLYGLQPADDLAVSLRYSSDSPAELATQAADEFVSFAVGCMFGRYSLDEPGLILADQSATVLDYEAKAPQPMFAPDADNVLPMVDGEWFEDDIVERFRQFLRVAFGEDRFEENLRFVEESLGVKTLRDYFITRGGKSKFYEDHVKRYKKRPIYWMFSSSRVRSTRSSTCTGIIRRRYPPFSMTTCASTKPSWRQVFRTLSAKRTVTARRGSRQRRPRKRSVYGRS
jgi:hypothetical protein